MEKKKNERINVWHEVLLVSNFFHYLMRLVPVYCFFSAKFALATVYFNKEMTEDNSQRYRVNRWQDSSPHLTQPLINKLGKK